MQYLLILMLMLTLSSCTPQKSMYQERVLVQANTEDLSKVVWDYTIELEHEKLLNLENNYVAAAEGESFIRFEFTSQQILEVGPARQLLVDVAEGFLERLNRAPVAKELLPYPFDYEHLEIYIYLESFHGEFVDPFYVGWIVLEKGMSYFYAFDLDNRELDYWHSRIEPYAKSKSFVEFERAAEKRYETLHPKPTSKFSGDRFSQIVGRQEPGAAGLPTVISDNGDAGVFVGRRNEAAAVRRDVPGEHLPDHMNSGSSQRTIRSVQ